MPERLEDLWRRAGTRPEAELDSAVQYYARRSGSALVTQAVTARARAAADAGELLEGVDVQSVGVLRGLVLWQ